MDVFSIISAWVMMIFLQVTPVADYAFIGSPVYVIDDALTIAFDANEPPAPDYWSVSTIQNWDDRSVRLTAGGYFDGEPFLLFN